MKRMSLVIIFSVCISISSSAQTFEEYIALGDSFILENYFKSDSLYNLANRLAEKQKDERKKAIVLTKRAIITTYNADYDQSLNLLNTALETFSALKDTLLMAKTEHDIGFVYRSTKDFEQAAVQNQKALELWKSANDSLLIGIGHRDLGVIYRKKGLLTQARKQYELAEMHFDPKTDIDQLVTLRGNFSTFELKEGNFQAAIDLNLKDLPYIKSKSKWQSLSTRYNNIAISYMELKDYNKALSYSDSSMQLAETKIRNTSRL